MTEGPYKLPEGWRWVRLGEACEINPRRPRLYVDPNEPTTFVPMTAVDDQAGTIATPEVRPFKQVQKGYTYFEEGDVLFAKITPCMENGKAAIIRGSLNGFGFGSTEFHVLRPGGSVIPEWIWLFIRQERFRKAAKDSFRGGVGQQRVPKKFLQQHPIPLPPLEEQRRIVARIEELMSRVREAKRLRQQATEDAERLWQSTLAETFPRPGAEPPPGWRWVRLGEVANIVSGFGFPKSFQGKPEGPIPFIKVSDLAAPENDPHIQTAVNYVDEQTLRRLKARAYDPGTVVFPKIGGAIATNRKRILGVRATFDNNIMGAIPLHERIIPRYLLAVFSTIDLNGLAENGPVPSIRKSTVQHLVVPLPPVAEQRRIVAHLEAVQEKVKALKDAQAATGAELQRLEQAILEKAFRGEL